MHATLNKFGYPRRLIFESPHWALLLRPVQVTLGSLVLISTSEATAVSHLSREAFEDLQTVSKALETALGGAFGYDKLNYLALMMVDPQVHFHILPRYSRRVSFAGMNFEDPAWPGPPDLSLTQEIDGAMADKVTAEIRRHLP